MEKVLHDALTPEILREAAADWGGRAEDLKLLGDVENFVYALPLPGAGIILRLTHSSHRSVEQVRAELDWLYYLAEHKADVCLPIESRRQELLAVYEASAGSFIAAAFSKAPGGPISRQPLDWSAELAAGWGAVTGRLHALTLDYRPAPHIENRPIWHKDDLTANAAGYLPVQDAGILERMQHCIQNIRSIPEQRENFGLIHSDIHDDNFFVHNGRFTLFDFDDAQLHYFAHDIAIPVYYALLRLPAEKPEIHSDFLQVFMPAFLQGYRREYHIAAGELEHLPLFLLLRDCDLLALCYKKDFGSERLRERLRNNIRNTDVYHAINFPALLR